ncbi:MAG TPA: putative manganese-dependent inorganic diphosphatase, partial [Eubacteriaceae bacterium]|nr:putative manganese-dependent inorganic diphosphatase [Eubacteriaceae bacterium]
MKEVMVFGHQNPDTDSVTSAIVLSDLKNKTGVSATPYILNEPNKESRYVLSHFGYSAPQILDNVKIQMKDLNYTRTQPLKEDDSIYDAYHYMGQNRVRTLPIVDPDNRLSGLVTMKDIAMSLINTDQRKIDTTFDNVLKGLSGRSVYKQDESISGEVLVTAFHLDTIEEKELFQSNSIVIVGDRYDIIEFALEKNVLLIIVTGKEELSPEVIRKAKEKGVNVITTNADTYETTKTIFLTNRIRNIMIHHNILFFKEEDYLEDCKDIIKDSDHSKFPLIDENGNYLGIISRNHIISPQKKKVVLVDHNEYAQSAEGIEEADILEIVDHHKIGDISTTLPIAFRNQPVGSTNTILFQMYKERGLSIPKDIAGLMMSGIISDTLLLKSPTTTQMDIDALDELKQILEMDIEQFAVKMFREGTDLSGKSVEEIFFSDYKEFVLEGMKTGISQIFTLDIDQISSDLQKYLDFIAKVNEDRNQYLTFFVVTDIIKQGSYIFYNETKKEQVQSIFKQKMKQGTFMQDCVSRKKQIIPA